MSGMRAYMRQRLDVVDYMLAVGTPEEWRAIFSRRLPRLAWRMWYHRYLHSAAWKWKRDLCMTTAGCACQRCKEQFIVAARLAVQVHHLTYDRLGDEKSEDLQAVCDQCHREAHGKVSGDQSAILGVFRALHDARRLKEECPW